MTLFTTLLLGLTLGVKHAFDADHLVAVSTIVTRHRSMWRSLSVGLWWGIGHTCTLLLIGVIVLGLKQQIAPPVGLLLECLVGLVLIGLGLSTLAEAWRKRLHVHRHTHGNAVHTHFHTHADTLGHHHAHPVAIGVRPLLVGMVHGLAGSAALMIVVLATLPTPALGVAYIFVFGCGSLLGMALVSLIMGACFSAASTRLAVWDQGVRLTVGLLSTACGIWIVIEIGFIQGLLVSYVI